MTLNLSDRSIKCGEWRLEPELAGPTPRALVTRWENYPWQVGTPLLGGVGLLLVIFFSPRTEAWLHIGLGVWVVVFTIWIAMALRDHRLSRALVERGTPTHGVVVDRTRIQASRAYPGHWNYVVSYEASEPRAIRSTVVRGDHWDIGDAVTVLYLPESPRRARLYEDCFHKAVKSTPGPSSRKWLKASASSARMKESVSGLLGFGGWWREGRQKRFAQKEHHQD